MNADISRIRIADDRIFKVVVGKMHAFHLILNRMQGNLKFLLYEGGPDLKIKHQIITFVLEFPRLMEYVVFGKCCPIPGK
jgi:hypothetical protein